MGNFTIRGFAKIGKEAMTNAIDRLVTAGNILQGSLKQIELKHVVSTSNVVIPKGAEISQPEAFWEIHQTLRKPLN